MLEEIRTHARIPGRAPLSIARHLISSSVSLQPMHAWRWSRTALAQTGLSFLIHSAQEPGTDQDIFIFPPVHLLALFRFPCVFCSACPTGWLIISIIHII